MYTVCIRVQVLKYPRYSRIRNGMGILNIFSVYLNTMAKRIVKITEIMEILMVFDPLQPSVSQVHTSV